MVVIGPEKEELLFIQLPNVLPGFPAVEEDSATQEGTSKDNKSNKENTNVRKKPAFLPQSGSSYCSILSSQPECLSWGDNDLADTS